MYDIGMARKQDDGSNQCINNYTPIVCCAANSSVHKHLEHPWNNLYRLPQATVTVSVYRNCSTCKLANLRQSELRVSLAKHVAFEIATNSQNILCGW